jgi:TonB family protein
MNFILKSMTLYLPLTMLFSCAGSRPKTMESPEDSISSEMDSAKFNISDFELVESDTAIFDSAVFDTPPIPAKNATPYYPIEAQQRNITGKFLVKVLVDSKGKVKNVIVFPDEGEDNQMFVKSAIDAARRSKWKPATKNGKPVAVWIMYKIEYKLR